MSCMKLILKWRVSWMSCFSYLKRPLWFILWFCNHLYVFVPEGILSGMISVLLRKYCLHASIPLRWSGLSLGSLHWLVSVHGPGSTIVCTTDFMIIGSFVCFVSFVCVLDLLRTQRCSYSMLQLCLSVLCNNSALRSACFAVPIKHLHT